MWRYSIIQGVSQVSFFQQSVTPHDAGVTVKLMEETFPFLTRRKIPSLQKSANKTPEKTLGENANNSGGSLTPSLNNRDFGECGEFTGSENVLVCPEFDDGRKIIVNKTTAPALFRVGEEIAPNFQLCVFQGHSESRPSQATLASTLCVSDTPLGDAHSRGDVVDVTLAYKKVALNLGVGPHLLSPERNTDAFDKQYIPEALLRRVLFWVMHSHGFVNAPTAWWHYRHMP